jgi:multidrug efflux pump subunit AcrB
MVDVFVGLPGATPAEVEQRITRPVERSALGDTRLEYLYSTSSRGQAMVIARFLVGEDEERALVRVNQKLAGAAGTLSPARRLRSSRPVRSTNVPMMAVTLWGPGYDDARLRLFAGQVRDAVKEIPNVSEVTVIGGRPRQVTVTVDPARA